MEKVTKLVVKYPDGLKPDIVNPKTYQPYRFFLGHQSNNPLVAIGMNPSAANFDISDRTVNRVIAASQKLGYDGWVVMNVYPERATNAADMNSFDSKLNNKNLAAIKEFLVSNKIKEVWGAWGDLKYEALQKGRDQMLEMFDELGIKVFHFGDITKQGNPRHPLYLKINPEDKRYLGEKK